MKHGIPVPHSMDEATKLLDDILTEDQKEYFQSIPEDAIWADFHYGFGLWLKHCWHLADERSQAAMWLQALGIEQPDDMTDVILLAYHRYLNGRYPEIDELVRECITP